MVLCADFPLPFPFIRCCESEACAIAIIASGFESVALDMGGTAASDGSPVRACCCRTAKAKGANPALGLALKRVSPSDNCCNGCVVTTRPSGTFDEIEERSRFCIAVGIVGNVEFVVFVVAAALGPMLCAAANAAKPSLRTGVPGGGLVGAGSGRWVGDVVVGC